MVLMYELTCKARQLEASKNAVQKGVFISTICRGSNTVIAIEASFELYAFSRINNSVDVNSVVPEIESEANTPVHTLQRWKRTGNYEILFNLSYLFS